ncbi:hypothetical protein IF1G_04954 [Cordyceps javanica]|uniref:Uncharacterized protein n=1 Tax=Cordyceps javanica TaxID=43265 RepID=A0A545V3U1_9HYPO|nr:hypothetical protein IF1G_04954 [Cordyceps javanica]
MIGGDTCRDIHGLYSHIYLYRSIFCCRLQHATAETFKQDSQVRSCAPLSSDSWLLGACKTRTGSPKMAVVTWQGIAG